MYDVVTIGSSLVDIFVQSSEFSLSKSSEGIMLCQPYGDKIDIDHFVVTSGGGGSNTAVGFSRMGFNAAVITEMGQDAWATLVMEDFHAERVATNLVVQEKREETGGSVILVGQDGGRTVLVHRGAASQLDPKDVPEQALEHTDWIHLSSISGQLETLEKIFAVTEKHKKRLSWNPGKAEIRALVQGAFKLDTIECNVLLVNAQEWELFADTQDFLKQMCKTIIVTDGPKGGVVLEDERERRFTSKHAQAKDETGAGDAFCVGYVSAILRGKTSEQAVEWGTINAAGVIQQWGAKKGLVHRKMIEIRDMPELRSTL